MGGGLGRPGGRREGGDGRESDLEGGIIGAAAAGIAGMGSLPMLLLLLLEMGLGVGMDGAAATGGGGCARLAIARSESDPGRRC